MQIEVVLSDTSSPTNMAIAHLPLLGRIGPAEDSDGLEPASVLIWEAAFVFMAYYAKTAIPYR